MHYPEFVAVTESWLDASVVSPVLHGYRLISRRDRNDGRKRGGIVFFAREDISNQIVHASTSQAAERTWHILHSCAGPVLLGFWCRPELLHGGRATRQKTRRRRCGPEGLGDRNFSKSSRKSLLSCNAFATSFARSDTLPTAPWNS